MITEEEAIKRYKESLKKSLMESIRQWQPSEITDEIPSGCYMAEEHYETGCWFMPGFSSGFTPPRIGATHIIGVSKKTGEVVFSGVVGE